MGMWNLKAPMIGCLAAVVLVAATVPQTAAAQAPEPDSRWIKACNADPDTSKELCVSILELRAKTGVFIASATVRQFTGESDISFAAAIPPGMLLQPGMRVQVDGGKEHKLPFEVCLVEYCYGEVKVDGVFIDAMKAGDQLTISALNQGGNLVAFPMTLIGFTKAHDGEGLDSAGRQARESELNRSLQARAEEARKRLINKQQSTAN